jgi:hypothetical protein
MKKYYYVFFDGVITQITTNPKNGFNLQFDSYFNTMQEAKDECFKLLKSVKREVKICKKNIKNLKESDFKKQKRNQYV